jgi:hypothetical protein
MDPRSDSLPAMNYTQTQSATEQGEPRRFNEVVLDRCSVRSVLKARALAAVISEPLAQPLFGVVSLRPDRSREDSFNAPGAY